MKYYENRKPGANLRNKCETKMRNEEWGTKICKRKKDGKKIAGRKAVLLTRKKECIAWPEWRSAGRRGMIVC